ncbi:MULTISPECIES: ABC transporter ATP-binding protein [Laedolimicola]|uniref:ABC transporter ATP-binding protein n=2 Tax=Laedolimicola TaxID=2981637 RepID=A0ABT2RU23_9FIRM|nr:ABC transporter ATP-binding protein [Laedolimicola ammoniilytica]MCU6695515.1 ABC transporter ATP-binding protein [Laedolimicola ammoniilytica]SCH01777.1 Aliphatic sulfonates import ATP-binding protein SsuB [uncultured Clostridium sp.]
MEKREVKVQVNHLTKRFGDLLVLDDISFEINKGEFVCIVGPTGCGKTTFLNLLTGLLEPTEGEILIDGERADPKKHSISFVFQEPSAFPWLTAQQNIEYGLRIKKKPEQEIVSQREKIIGLLGLEKYRDAYPHEMSVSMEQRVVIGRAFALNPDLLLMDEPYGQMDIKMRYYLEDEVIRLWQATGSTVLFITHNLEEATYLAERVLILTNKPAKIKTSIDVDLPRPRQIADPKFIEIRKEITDMIKWW